MRKILVTGANGFIGRHLKPILEKEGCEIHALSRYPLDSEHPGVKWYPFDLLTGKQDQLKEIIQRIAPTELVHLAWCTQPGAFWSANENLVWVDSSLNLVRAFVSAGGKRILVTGSCAEYRWSDQLMDEGATPLEPRTLYGQCKNRFRSAAKEICNADGIELAWVRLFNMYGPHEHPKRLVSSVIQTLLSGNVATCSSGTQTRDFTYIEDVAQALCDILSSKFVGAVNFGSGQRFTVRHVVERIAGILGAVDRVRFGDTVPAGEPLYLVPSLDRLHEITDWSPRHDLETGLAHTINWWQNHSSDAPRH
ncbi:MAG TPA: NAD(P)-dependent oxidoreductase [Bdellovibrionota bacterium]|nr:NAD(P)-dependent oxidoreductase [Bdellovibrionota bacterium]